MEKEYNSFKEFYPFYLSEHKDANCRRLHFLGSLLVVLTLVYIVVSANWFMLLLLPIIGYGFAWLGHLVFEKNRPATFSYPLYSFLGDWAMFKDILTGKVKL